MRALMSTLALVLLLSGCAETVAGRSVEAKVFDPCALPAAALQKAGALPETKDDSIQFPGFRICSWKTEIKSYYLTVFTSERTLSDYRENKTKTDFRDIEVVGRKGLQYQEVDLPLGTCAIGFDTAFGSVHVEMHRAELEGDACPYAIEKARTLAPNLPR